MTKTPGGRGRGVRRPPGSVGTGGRGVLTLGARGAVVAQLHAALVSIGLEISDEEFQSQSFGDTTRAAIVRLQTVSGLDATGAIDEPTLRLALAAFARLRPPGAAPPGRPPGDIKVSGVVSDADGLPIAGAVVVARVRGLRTSREAGRTTTDRAGRYILTIARPASSHLQLSVQGPDGKVLYTSPVQHNVAGTIEVPLPLGGAGRTEPPALARLSAGLAPHLEALRPEEIVEDAKTRDLTFLADSTGIDKETIAHYSIAARLASDTRLPADLFFALLRQNVPGDSAVVALASTQETGVDLEKNARRLLDSILAASPRVRAQAVDMAIARHDVAASYAARAERDLTALEDLATTAALASSNGLGKAAIGSVLESCGVPADTQRAFIALYAAARGPMRTFWLKLRKDDRFTKEQVATLRFALDIGRFSRGHLPLVRALASMRREGRIKGTRDLARFTAAGWKKLLMAEQPGSRPIGIPENFTAATHELAIDTYATLLERNFERAYPTAAFAARLSDDAASPFPAARDVAAFLEANPAFSLKRTNADTYLKDRPGAIPSSGDQAFRGSLRAAQRLAKLGQRYAVARVLMADGVSTAQQVYARGPSRFVETYGAHPDIGKSQAARIYAVAEQTYSLALSVATRFNAGYIGVSPIAVGGPLAPGPTPSVPGPSPAPAPAPSPAPGPPAPTLDGQPNLATLFGSFDFCACLHCRSVMSPAAYLVDMLQFLSHRITAGTSAKDVLLARRPDLVQIELSCANSNTVLPYIDLVNELLEDAVAPPADPTAAARARQTTLTTDELNANPEHVNPAAYAALAGAVFPWKLPFDLPLAEARTYLGHLGSDRVALMRALRPEPAIPSAEALTMAIEGLGLSPGEAHIITGADGHSPWEFWGLAETGNTVVDPVDHTVSHSGTWLQVLSHPRVLLHRAGLTYAELSRLLGTRFINPTGALAIALDPEGSCDLGAAAITGLDGDPESLSRLHRFVRLQRRLGWSTADLDGAIACLRADAPPGLGRLDSLLLRQLHAVTAAMKRFRIPATAGVSLLASIDTHVPPRLPGDETAPHSPYQDLFQNLAVSSPVDTVFDLDGAGVEIAAIATNPRLLDHRGTLIGAFELSDADLTRAIESFTDGALTVANLSRLYRHVILARGLRVTVAELTTLRALIERETGALPAFEIVDPFGADRPELLGRFCEAVDRIRSTDFSIAQLDYLLRGTWDPVNGVGPDDVAIGTLLKSIRDGLLKVAAENAFSPDVTGVEVRRRLATLMGRSEVDALMAVLAGTSSLSATDQDTLLADLLGAYLDATDAQGRVGGSGDLAAGTARYEYVLERLLATLRRALGTGVVVQQLAEALGLPIATVADLTGSWFQSILDPTLPVVEDFLALPGVARDPGRESEPIGRDEAGFGARFDEYVALHKAAQVVSGFAFTPEEVSWLHDFGVAEGWLDPADLPGAPAATPGGRFVRWRRLADAALLKTSLPSDGTSFTTLLDPARTGADKATCFAALQARTRWPAEGLRALAGDPANVADRGLLGLTFPGDYRSERALARLLPAFALLRRLGIPADVAGWLGPTVAAADAEAIKQSVKAKYSADRWPAIAKPLRDRLREQQRDALVAWMLAHPPAGATTWRDVNDVYAHFLIDVEMCACQGTSRIVQANAAIQLFVQRCILNLEPDVTVDSSVDVAWLQWKWMSRYRVWEANRKVFWYPENWIDPALRLDKSIFFKEMENDLLQDQVTSESAEEALRAYLTKLDQVARLEVVGQYHDLGNPAVSHVFARRQGDPPTFYYRRWEDSSRWTAWSKVELDILSDHVLPVMWNRRLYLFWAIVTCKPDQTQGQGSVSANLQSSGSFTYSNSGSAPAVHLEIRLAWSELKGDKWQAKQTAPQVLVVPGDRLAEFITLKSSVSGPLLRIDVFEGDSIDRYHIAEFVLGGVGNAVEALATNLSGFFDVGTEARFIGTLPSALNKGQLLRPTGTSFDGMVLLPRTTTQFSPDRPRVSAMTTAYDLYGALESEVVLDRADLHRLLVPHQTVRFDSSLPFFYIDGRRTYFIVPATYYRNGNYFTTTAPTYVYHPFYKAEYKFAPFYHAFVPLLIRELNAGGIDRLYARRLQREPAAVQGTGIFDFFNYYKPTGNVIRPLPTEGIDFDYNAGYAIYNWELFFHAPFQIGAALSLNQRFEEAKRWYEYIFNPTSTTDDPSPQRYWVTKPFYEMTDDDYRAQSIQGLMSLIGQHDAAAEHQVAVWRAHPFEPHVIAELRPVAYQRAIVMRYIDNLIAWGDHLFRQDTMESVNEATQLYVLAAELLGPRPEIVPKGDVASMTYAELEPSLDDLSNAVVTAAENVLPPVTVDVEVDPSTPSLPVVPPLYFCVPPNETLLSYWDTVADRLFKIRHCMNIEGVVRQLPLFAPPIDPGLLVRATAAGLDLGSILNDTSAARPPYRFRVIAREAMELAELVRAHGFSLLATLEKRDAERMALLRSGAEKKLQDRVRAVHQRSVDEMTQQLEVIARNREVVLERQAHFASLKDNLMNAWEIAAQAMTAGSMVANGVAMALQGASGTAHALPDAQFGGSGVGGSPHATAKIGGSNAGNAAEGWAVASRIAAALLQTGAQMSATLGQYKRRQEDAEFAHEIASRELSQIDAQTLATQIRIDVMSRQRDNHEIVADTAAEADELVHGKFTNKELFEWMLAKTSAVYFQAYQLAYTVARRAEQCFRRELGIDESSFINFGYWDSLKKGLCAADGLLHDLRRMEAAYLAQNERELEMTRHASLLSLDPYALMKLRSTGECLVTLPELWFDLETPGHYMRRLKMVAITVPCVTGPYVGVSLTATLMDHHVRTSTSLSPQYERSPGDDTRFVDAAGGTSAIVTSHAQKDAGMFFPNLEDDRYLPFEGEGAIGTWKLRLNPVLPQFDPNSISDVILHLSYTARDGGAILTEAARQAVRDHLNIVALAESRRGLYRLFSARQEFATAWARLVSPSSGADQVLAIDTAPSRFAFFTSGFDLRVTGIDVLARLSDPGDYTLEITRPGASPQTVTMSVDPTLGGLHAFSAHPLSPASDLGSTTTAGPPPAWTFKLRKAGAADFRSLTEAEIEDLVIILQYTVNP
jgi:hypothetical protein